MDGKKNTGCAVVNNLKRLFELDFVALALFQFLVTSAMGRKIHIKDHENKVEQRMHKYPER